MREIWFCDERGEEALLVPNLREDWEPPQVGDVWGPFRVVEVDEEGGTVTIEVADLGPISP